MEKEKTEETTNINDPQEETKENGKDDKIQSL